MVAMKQQGSTKVTDTDALVKFVEWQASGSCDPRGQQGLISVKGITRPVPFTYIIVYISLHYGYF